MLKVTDICSTDPKDPSSCATPADIKIDRIKADLLFHKTTHKTAEETAALKHGNQYPHKVWWFFMKCWDDGLVEDAYNLSSNWFANPPLPENKVWAQNPITQQYKNNQATYPKAGLPSYPNGAYKNYSKLYFDEVRKSTWLFNYTKYWKPGDPDPERCPVAGGKGHSVPPGKC